MKKNVSLLGYHTFKTNARARYFHETTDLDDLRNITDFVLQEKKPLFVLGGGSNILFINDFPGVVIKNSLRGIRKVKNENGYIYLKIMAGENWEEVVQYCLDNNMGGIENLTLIPGNSGTAPMQNIGAYGVEIKDVFHELEALEIKTGNLVNFSNKDCEFGYRDSFFKNKGKGKYIIISVTLKLTVHSHEIKTGYGNVLKELEKSGISNPGIKDVAHVIRKIRTEKLPDPNLIGNAGSFFKNPVIKMKFWNILKERFPELPGYPLSDEEIKVPAGYLIEKAGWKGYRYKNAGVHEKQALVLINHGKASGIEIFELSSMIVEDILQKFKIKLEREVNIIGSQYYFNSEEINQN